MLCELLLLLLLVLVLCCWCCYLFRTFLHWMNVSVTIGSISAALSGGWELAAVGLGGGLSKAEGAHKAEGAWHERAGGFRGGWRWWGCRR